MDMAFWKKKSDDPWDREPEKPAALVWQEAPAEPETAGREPPVPKDTPEQPRLCPWCGETLVKGYLYTAQGEIWWREGIATRFSNLAAGERMVSNRGFFGAYRYKDAWHCAQCRKMTFDFW